MRILVVDCTIDLDSRGSEDLVRFARPLKGATVLVRRAPEGDLPASLDGIDRVVVSGSKTSCLDPSPWLIRLEGLIREAVEKRKPYLGVCFGHQMLCRAFGGTKLLGRSKAPELGWTRIERAGPAASDDPLLAGLPKSFWTFESHHEEVLELPAGFVQLARSEISSIQAARMEGRPAWGIQFHPEKDLADARKSFARWKREKVPAKLLREEKSDGLYDPKVGERIFNNFFGVAP